MARKLKTWGPAVAGLCLLCCAAPFAVLFAGGAGLAGLPLLLGNLAAELQVLGIVLGVMAMAAGAWMIWHRRRTASRCNVPAP